MASADVRELFVVGLRNAHAMEREAISMMESQIGSLESYPELKLRLETHLKETRAQDERLESILGQLGEDTSTFKDTVVGMMGSVNAMAASMADDAILKATFANSAFESSRRLPIGRCFRWPKWAVLPRPSLHWKPRSRRSSPCIAGSATTSRTSPSVTSI